MKPSISVIIPVYNVEAYIERCTRSLFEQTLQNIEYIFIDDCSTDKSIEILLSLLREYPNRESQVRILRNKQNLGQGSTREIGLNSVSGEYVIHCDPDDWLEKRAYEMLYRKAIESGSDIVSCGYWYEYADKSVPYQNCYSTQPELSFTTQSHEPVRWFLWSRLIKVEFIKRYEIHFPNHINMWEDMCFLVKCYFFANRIEQVKDCLYHYNRVNQTSISNSEVINKIPMMIATIKELDNFRRGYTKSCRAQHLNSLIIEKKILIKHFLVSNPALFSKVFPDVNSKLINELSKNNVFNWVLKSSLKGFNLPLVIYWSLNKYKIRLKETIFKRINDSFRYRLSYLRYDIKRKYRWKPLIMSDEETVNMILAEKCSLARYGDGEIRLMEGDNITFQDFNPVLAQKLKEVIMSNNKNVLIAIPIGLSSLKVNNEKEQSFWYHHLYKSIDIWYKYLNRSVLYSNSQISRFYSTTPAFLGESNEEDIASIRIKNLKRLWDKRDCVFIEGEYSRLGVGNNCFENAKSIRRILCPAVNAFSKYDEIIKCVLEYVNKEELLIIALGPTATVLSYELANNGYQCLDLGHIDIEYEWWRTNAVGKQGVRGKYSNEAVWGGNQKSFVEGALSENEIKIYRNQIIKLISGDRDCISSREKLR